MIAAGRGTRFDPRIVDVLLGLTDEFERIARELADETTRPG